MSVLQPPDEQELATRQDVRAVDEKVDRVDAKVDRVDAKVERVGEQVHRLEKKFERMEEKLDAVLTVMREHMASKRDVERMGRLMAMWVGTASVALLVAMLSRL